MKKLDWTDAPGLIGLGCVFGGLAHFSLSIAFVVIGCALVFYSYSVGK